MSVQRELQEVQSIILEKVPRDLARIVTAMVGSKAVYERQLFEFVEQCCVYYENNLQGQALVEQLQEMADFHEEVFMPNDDRSMDQFWEMPEYDRYYADEDSADRLVDEVDEIINSHLAAAEY